MSLRNGTICSKHDKISGKSGDIRKSCAAAVDLLREIEGFADDVESLADAAKDDGQRMEDGLGRKRERIAELENANAALERQLEEVTRERDSLAKDVAHYEAELAKVAAGAMP